MKHSTTVKMIELEFNLSHHGPLSKPGLSGKKKRVIERNVYMSIYLKLENIQNSAMYCL